MENIWDVGITLYTKCTKVHDWWRTDSLLGRNRTPPGPSPHGSSWQYSNWLDRCRRNGGRSRVMAVLCNVLYNGPRHVECGVTTNYCPLTSEEIQIKIAPTNNAKACTQGCKKKQLNFLNFPEGSLTLGPPWCLSVGRRLNCERCTLLLQSVIPYCVSLCPFIFTFTAISKNHILSFDGTKAPPTPPPCCGALGHWIMSVGG